MGVRYRKYFPQCKPIECNGKSNKRYCPEDRPKRSNSEYKTCGTWCIEFFDDNKEWQSLTFKDIRNKTDAEKRLALFISDRERGQLNLPKRKSIPTLTEYSQKYLELYRTARENTLAVKQKTVNNLLRYIGQYKLDQITSFIIEKYRIERKEKDQVKDGTINDDITTLKHIFNTAIKGGMIDKNPCRDIKQLKNVTIRDRILTGEEIALLLHKLQGKDRYIVLTSLFCGMRLGEVLSLLWSNINFTKGLISFVQSKTGKLVIVPLASYLANELITYKGNTTGDNLFEDPPITTNTVKRYSLYFSNLFKQLGLHGFTYHHLRHTFATLQSDVGGDIVTTKELLGHSNIAMTMRYSHKQLDVKRHAIEKMTDHIIGLTQEKVVPLVVQA